MNQTIVALVAMEAEHALEGETTLEGRLKAAFKAVQHHWMATDKDDQMYGALAAVLKASGEEDQERLKLELTALRSLNAAGSGVPVDFAAIRLPEKPVGIMKLWGEATAAAARS